LKQRDQDILIFIEAFNKSNNCGPTDQELANYLSVSAQAAGVIKRRLVRDGYLKYNPKMHRSLQCTDKKWG